MNPKETFLASLSDEQLGFFCAHEYNENLSDMLQDEINVIQYQLYEKWKEYEKKTAHEKSQQSSALNELTEKMNKMMEMFTERMDSIEMKLSETTKLNNSDHDEASTSSVDISDNMNSVIKVLTTRMDLIEKKIDNNITLNNTDTNLNTSLLMDLTEEMSKMNDMLGNKMEQLIAQNKLEIDRIIIVEKHLADINVAMTASQDAQSLSEDLATEKIEKVAETMATIKNDVKSIGNNNKDMDVLNDKVDNIWCNTILALVGLRDICTWSEVDSVSRVTEGRKSSTPIRTPSMGESAAIEWLTSNETYLSHATAVPTLTSIIETTIALMRKFDYNKTTGEKGCNVLDMATSRFEKAVKYIANTPGAIKHLMKLVEKDSEKENRLKLFHVLTRISKNTETQMTLVKREYLNLFLKEDNCTFHSTCILVHLIELTDEVNLDNKMKQTIEKNIITTIDSIELGKYSVNNFPWYLNRIKTGTKAQRQFCACIAANESKFVFGGSLKSSGAIPILEDILSDPETDSQVNKYAEIALQNTRKSFIQRLFQ